MNSVDAIDRVDAPPLTVAILRSFDEANELAAEWDRFAERMAGLIYQTYDWCRIWWENYSLGRELRLLVFRSGDELVGILPLFIDVIGFWPFEIRVAKCISTEFSTSRYAPLIVAKFEHSVRKLALTQLFKKDGCHLFSIGPVANAKCLQEAISKVVDRSMMVSIQTNKSAVLMTQDLSRGFEGMVDNMSARSRQKLRNRMKRFEEYDGVVVRRITEAAELEAEFEDFCELHRQRWTAQGRQGHFDDWQNGKVFHRQLIAAQAAHGRCRLYKISRENEVISYTYGYAFGEWYFSLLPARSTEEEWERLGIGKVSSLIQMRYEAEDGRKRVDLGQGYYCHKKELGAKVERLDRVRVFPRTMLNRARVVFWLTTSKFIHVVYYKLWFMRIRPRLRFASRPLSCFWNRIRF